MLQERIPTLVHFGGINVNYRLSKKKTLLPSASEAEESSSMTYSTGS